ncbi:MULTISPECIES: SDR family oxidoreductase [unclassified Streptomyces]|uniref:SDR family oxidoreductase n=1 Tax=unclassified Streptomyces TaxID=2593676 RepID=UPI00081F4A9C|nr:MULTISPECIES: SDR family oxidoreductase [unclassified Streptomyces]MYR30013.1 NAD-dependent epimerase/dehydratase family protein [Streptomyces sp. SID4945]SCD77563.1 Nucleoside-diphosphate-sugar epimerase [Streptomyces sp. TverLS-915]SCF48422.1 Nucleoside-diphosphate-sugar epimerase [Streptomyces sp. LcepLS]
MRVFVTGASGWIGSALVPELLAAGHHVLGLARSEASATALEKAGAEPVHGSLADLDLLQETARASDAVAHLAFRHDIAFTGDFLGAARSDRTAVDAFGEVLAGTDKPFTIASGLLGLAPGQVATETTWPVGDDDNPGSARAATARATVDLADKGVRSSVVRLAPTVHGEGDGGFVPALVGIAREKGVSGYIGDGTQRWPAVHRLDAARLFLLALENAPAGAVLHAAAEEGISQRDIATVIGENLNLPVTSVAPADAPAHFGWLAGTTALDSPASATRTKALLDWNPTGPGLLADMAAHYFTA